MRSLAFWISLFLAVFIIVSHADPDLPTLDSRSPHRNGTHRDKGTKKTCKKFARLTRLSEFAKNQTRIDEFVAKGRLKDGDVERLKAKGADADNKLRQIKNDNATLAAECTVFAADRKVRRQCFRMRRLTRLASMHDNQTAIEEFATRRGLSQEKITSLQVKVAEAPEKLAELQANSTLVDLCAQRQAEREKRKKEREQQNGGQGAGRTGTQSSCPTLTPDAGGSTANPQAAPVESTGGADSLVLRTLSYTLLPCLATALAFLV